MDKYFIVSNLATGEEIKYTFYDDYIEIDNSIHGIGTLEKNGYSDNQLAMELLNSVLKNFVLMEFNLM